MASPTDPIAARIALLSPAQRQQLDNLLRAKGLYLESDEAVTAEAVSMDFSFMFFADDRPGRSSRQYDLLLEAARFD